MKSLSLVFTIAIILLSTTAFVYFTKYVVPQPEEKGMDYKMGKKRNLEIDNRI